MDWRRCEAGAESDVLRRIVILLFSLADLADLVAAVPARNRVEVLRILLWGEAAARRFIVETAVGGVVANDMVPGGVIADGTGAAGMDGMVFAMSFPVGTSGHRGAPGAEAALAIRLRALALFLCLLLAAALGGEAGARLARGDPDAPPPAARHAALPAVDTS